MKANLKVALRWLETAAAIISIVVPATRKVAELLAPYDIKTPRLIQINYSSAVFVA